MDPFGSRTPRHLEGIRQDVPSHSNRVRWGNPEPPFTQMEVVLNWTEELKQRVPTR